MELKAAIQWQAMEELNHNHSYQYIISSMYPNPTEMLDNIADNVRIQDRLANVTPHGNGVRAAATMLGLEALAFTTSFLTTIALNATFNSKLAGSKVQIQKIAADEAGHVVLWSQVIKILMAQGLLSKEDICHELNFIISNEVRWSKYLYNIYPLPQIEPNAVELLLRYKAHLIVRGLGIPQNELERPALYEWYQRTIDINTTLSELQATDTGAYVTDILIDDWSANEAQNLPKK
jgi:ribonucleotide reductase beta subunit family protein with ferritin-like domain